MQYKVQYLTILSIFLCLANISAQKKYALIIGINKYYDKPGVMHRSMLRGCVNDAMAIKGLLQSRFDFQNENITLLTNEAASSNNVDQAFNDILKKVKQGDAFVFYFSGHGVWINNASQNKIERKLKKGMNQAIVLSDLYAKNLGCLYKDANLKRNFNKFVDKDVVVTSIFDCCFSGFLTMVEGISEHNPYQSIVPAYSQRSLEFEDVLDSYILSNDTLSSLSIEASDSVLLNMIETTTKGFNLRDNLNISDTALITRPAERPKSMFLSLSGTNDVEKGEEMKDANGNYHGVFTKALLQVMNESPVNIPLSTLFEKIQKLVSKNGFIQKPQHFQDPARLKMNLIGKTSTSFRDNPVASYTTKRNELFELNLGQNAGIYAGNVFSLTDKKPIVRLEVVKSEVEYSLAKLIAGKESQFKKGQRFVRTGNFIKSDPIIKLYVNLSPISQSDFNKLIADKLLPLSKTTAYRDYSNWNATDRLTYLFLEQRQMNAIVNNIDKNAVMAFLPLPNYLLSAFRAQLTKNQNYKLVTKSDDADLILYLNYANGNGGRYVFTWYSHDLKLDNGRAPSFYKNNVSIPALPKNQSEISKLTQDLSEMTRKLVQARTGIWLNDHLRK